MAQSNIKRLAKNTLFLYIRQIIVMLISLYTSRILLSTLGVSDYGIYNLVGSIIAMISMLKGMFSYTTQRYLNYEMGLGNLEHLRTIFSMSVMINIVVSVLFVVFVEALGWWFFEYKINIPADRMFAAQCVFHLSVLSSVITILTTPYDAVLIANERFDFFAIISIIEAVLRLCAILLLAIIGVDRLITYGILILLISLIIRVIYGIYCGKHLSESKFKYCWDKTIFYSMLSFSWWQIFGNSAYGLTQNGINMVFNVFGGPVVNAARGVSMQVFAATKSLLTNVSSAITPYSIKAYAENNYSKVEEMFFFSSKVLYLINLLLTIPLIVMTSTVLNLWLGDTPDFSISFVQITLTWSLVNSLHSPIDTIFMATGRIKTYQLTEGIILSLPLVFSYILLRLNFSYSAAMSTMVVFEIVNWFIIVFLLRRKFLFDIKKYIIGVFIPVIISLCICIVLIIYGSLIQDAVIIQIVTSVVIDFVFLACFYMFIFNKQEKIYVKSLIKKI